MPIVFFVLLIILIAQVGFWDTFGAILGAAAMIGLFAVIAVALVAVAILMALRRMSR